MKKIYKILALVVLIFIVIIVSGQTKYYTLGQKLVANDTPLTVWTKDGKFIYWYLNPQLSMYNVDEGTLKVIDTSNWGPNFFPDKLSPDNKHFVSAGLGFRDLTITSTITGKSKVIYRAKKEVFSPNWISDDLIIFTAYPQRAIYTIHKDGTGLIRVCDGAAIESVSADGNEFVYSTRFLEGYRKFYDLKYHISRDFKENYEIEDPERYPLVRFAYLSSKAAVYFKFNNGKVDYWLLDLKTMEEKPLYISRVAKVPMQHATISPDLSNYMWERQYRNGHSKLYIAKLPKKVREQIKQIEAKN